jgi:hypothetical protein
MPLLDHFKPPLVGRPDWPALHTDWIGQMAADLNLKWLPPHYRAEVECHYGPELVYDVGVIREPGAVYTATLEDRPAVPDLPLPDASCPFQALPYARVLVRNAGGELVGVIELISERNKDRPEARDGFAAKIQSYLQAEISLVVVDVITFNRPNLHNHWCDRFNVEEAPRFQENAARLYAVAYHPWRDMGSVRLDFWMRPLTVGEELPTIPLFIRSDLAAPIELEVTYTETCRRLRVTVEEAAA